MAYIQVGGIADGVADAAPSPARCARGRRSQAHAQTNKADKRKSKAATARACGLSPLAIAAEKYLLTLALGALSFALLAVCQAVIGEIDWMLNAGFFAINLMIGAVVFPVLFKFGVEKGRLALIAALVAAIALSVLLMSVSGSITTPLALALFTAACLALFALSMWLSAKILGKKDM